MYSPSVLDHFQNPRNAGVMEKPTATVEVANPVCGDMLSVSVQVREGTIVAAKFLCRGCTTSIACASRLTERISGARAIELKAISAEEIAESLGGLPAETFHGAHLAVDAARALADKLAIPPPALQK
jgi:nitrogen fixation NifU-like protein